MREALLEGKCEYPGSKMLEKYPDKAEAILRFWQALWWSFLNNRGVNGVYWYEELGPTVLNKLLVALDHHKWVESRSITGRNWIEILLLPHNLYQYVSEKELDQIKAKYKHDKYILKASRSGNCDVVKTSVGKRKTGLVRTGFMRAGESEFSFDNDMITKYKEAIVTDANKSMEKILKMYPDISCAYSYDSTVEAAINTYECSTDIYTTGSSGIDQRGRAVSECLGKIGNPISSKMFRALTVIK